MDFNIIRSWNGRTIRQREDGYFNLTDMAKSCGKRFPDWFRLQDSLDYLNELSRDTGLSISKAETLVESRSAFMHHGLVEIKRGGIPEEQGTWGHELVALEFARWLNKAFAIQCNKWIRELLLRGEVKLANEKSQPVYLPPLVQAEKALDIVERYKLHFGTMNPQMEQHFKDMVGNCMIDFMALTHQDASKQKELWMGVVNFAEVELGYKLDKKGEFRDTALGTWIRHYYTHLSDKQERRFCNETQRDIWVYPIHKVKNELAEAVHAFFQNPAPGTQLRLDGAFKRKPKQLTAS